MFKPLPQFRSRILTADYPDGTVIFIYFVFILEREWQSVPVANVQFVANAAGGVNCRVRKVPAEQSPNKGFFSWLKSVIFSSKHITICTAACILGMVIFFIWRVSIWEQPGGAPDPKSPDPSRV